MPNKFSLLRSTLITVLGSLMVTLSSAGAVADWKSFDEKVTTADSIVLGEMVSSESRRDPGGRWIRTWTTFRVSEVLKGQSGNGTITIVTPGGTVDGIHQESVGAPAFEPGREQVLFLKQTPDGITPLYLGQGVYDVSRDDRNRPMVHPSGSNLILYDDQTGTVVPVEATRTLDRFRSDIRSSLDREKGVTRATSMEGEKQAETGMAEFLGENALVLILLSIGLLIALIIWWKKQ